MRGNTFYQHHYIELEKSVRQIAEEQGEHPEKIRRELKSLKIKIRSKEKSLALAKEQGRCKSPFQENGMPDKVKQKISESLKKYHERGTDATSEED